MLSTLYSYRASLLLTIVVLFLSLYPFAEAPKIELRFGDKYTHFLMYGGYALSLWVESTFAPKRRIRQALWALCVVWPILLGGLNEELQSTPPTTRHGDFYDFHANSIGVLLAFPFGWRFLRRYGA